MLRKKIETKFWQILNLADFLKTGKLPNLTPRQYFPLYGIHGMDFDKVVSSVNVQYSPEETGTTSVAAS